MMIIIIIIIIIINISIINLLIHRGKCDVCNHLHHSQSRQPESNGKGKTAPSLVCCCLERVHHS